MGKIKKANLRKRIETQGLKRKFQIICDRGIIKEWGNEYAPEVTVYIQSPEWYGGRIDCISDQEAPYWLYKEIKSVCPNASEIMESMFVMPADEFRKLTKMYPDFVLWFRSGKKLTPDEIEEYINLFKK